ncbi:uncharacterized protein BXZ73DRAFT_77912 [Epithele typhae]|uniref:uncharacterized protein n=1 Tax=Epithele typhae TaxID=378194 RepID=UPI002008B7B7|nr:uncharacterized protein BXZ73DRAFT_77912 [Epithele typhae]KAH9930467.1 hypothetical protein BXZ73DRAFT_77912 [Epithele typhae]
MLPLLLLAVLPLFVCFSVHAASFAPASIPLAVRAPYVNAWQNSTNGSAPISNSWAKFWSQTGPDLGWRGYIRIDRTMYVWMGDDPDSSALANITAVQVTPTRSIYTMQAGPMSLTVTFLSPLEPSDWVRQSIPLSYVALEATANDNAAHTVQVYSDITAVNWTSVTTSSSLYHEVDFITPVPFTELSDRAMDGRAFYATAAVPSLSWQIEEDQNVHDNFKTDGRLPNTVLDTQPPDGLDHLVFGLAIDLGTISKTSQPVSWVVGNLRNPTILYVTPTGETEDRVPYYTTQYSSAADVIDAFTTGYSDALARAIALDDRITGDAGKISSEYVDLVSLSTRPTLASLDITVSQNADGSVNASDVMVFMRDVGTSSRINLVERMYASFPAFLYLNASLAGAMLQPLLQSQSQKTLLPYAVQDLGLQYPIASGGQGGQSEGVEETGNMLIMMYAHAKASGDGTLLAQNYHLAKKWADYLVSNNNAVLTPNQVSADGVKAANTTNLAIKGIIAIKAMAEISRVFGALGDANMYDSNVTAMVQTWTSLATSNDSSGRILGQYGNSGSWALMYNLYPDVLLGTGVVPQSLLASQTQYYKSLLQTNGEAPQLFSLHESFLNTVPSDGTYGLPITSTPNSPCSLSWLLFTSATLSESDTSTRDSMISGAWNRTSYNGVVGSMPDDYQCTTGAGMSGAAGPALGAMYAHLALNVVNSSFINVPFNGSAGSTDSGIDNGKSSVGPIVGGVVGGVAVLVVAGVPFWYFQRRRRPLSDVVVDLNGCATPQLSQAHSEGSLPPSMMPHPSPLSTEPYPLPDGQSSVEAQMSLLSSPAQSPQSATGSPPAYVSKVSEGVSPPRLVPNRRPAPPPPTAGRYSKAREAARPHQAQKYVVNASAGLDPDSISPDGLSRRALAPHLETDWEDGQSATSGGGVSVLREEVERLRAVVEELREQRLAPPPRYDS